MSDPLLFSLVQDLEFQTGYRIKQVVSTRGDISRRSAGYPDKALADRTTAGRVARRAAPPEGALAETALARRRKTKSSSRSPG